MNISNKFLTISTIIIFIIPFLILQMYLNIVILCIFVIKEGFKSFTYTIFYNIKFKKNNNFYYFTNFTYEIFLIIILGNLFILLKILYKLDVDGKKLLLIGFILAVISLPLSIIVNPSILLYIAYTNKFDYKKMNAFLEELTNLNNYV